MVTPQSVRIKAVKTYIKGGESLRKTSEKLKIPHLTLWRWVRWYKEGGRDNLLRKKPYRRPWNRPPMDIEKKVMLFKEVNPALTISNAQKMLEKDGIKLSFKGIWSIWKRYALTGGSKERPYAPFGTYRPEIDDSLRKIKHLLADNRIKEASEIANTLSSFPRDHILMELTEKFLSPRRQLDRLDFFWNKIPFPVYYAKAKRIRKALEKRGLLYSSIFAGLSEFFALNAMVSPTKELNLTKLLMERARGIRNPSLRFLLLLNKGIICINSMHYEEAKECLIGCKKLVRYLPYPFFYDSLACFMTKITDYKNASLYYKKTLKMEKDRKNHRILYGRLALTYATAGKYRESMRFLRNAEKSSIGSRSSYANIRAFCAFGEGNTIKASQYYTVALEKSETGQLRNHLAAASLGLTAIQSALGNGEDVKTMLSKYLAFFTKYKMGGEVLMRNALLRKKVLKEQQIRGHPIFHLLLFLQNGCKGYKKALRYAQDNALMGFFHRIIPFFPEPVWALLEQGKPTGLPKSILKLPIFRRDTPVYSVRFLGPLVVYRNKEYIRGKLAPKDVSFLIYLASSKEKSIPLDRVFRNFWPDSRNPSRNLSHLLVRIRKFLKLPSHYLYIKSERLFFDLYFRTDYDKYKENVAQAKVLNRVGEWGFAKREYLHAFSLFRGEPFRKMYDNWSDDKRLEVLFSYETEILSFARELIKRDRNKEAVKLLKKAEKISPYSDEIKDLPR